MAIVYLGMVGITGYMMQSGSWESCTIKVKSLNVAIACASLQHKHPYMYIVGYIVIYEGQEDQHCQPAEGSVWSSGVKVVVVMTHTDDSY